jgi:MFS family permease
MTPWRSVVIMVVGGVIAAFQVGKAAIAVPFLRHDLGISLASASWVLGAYGALGALAGLPAGIAVSRIGPRRALLSGLCIIGAGTMLGALANSAMPLILCRVLEGCGFLGVVISIPTLLRGVVAKHDLPLAFTFWSAYMPVGTAIMMVLGAPLAGAFGWRTLWLLNGVAALSYAVVLWRLLPRDQAAAGTASIGGPAQLVRAPASLALALAFGT